MTSPDALPLSLVSPDDPRRAWVVLGSGGVGKTTLSAALALRFAAAGRRTAVVTLDPARRLADALGISRDVDALQEVPLGPLEARVGARLPGNLVGGVLDTKAMFDALVAARIDDPERAARILGNRYYQKLSTSLAGAENFMAVAKLDELLSNPAHERVVFDTPPAFHTLEFLSTPERLTGFLDFPGIRPAMRLMNGPVKGWAPLLEVGRVTLKGLERFLGREFLTELFAFLALFADVLDAFTEQARAVRRLLDSPDLGYLLVLAPTARSVAEGERVLERFQRDGRRLTRAVFNRVHPARFDGTRLERLDRRLAARIAERSAGDLDGPAVLEAVRGDLLSAVRAQEELARRQRAVIDAFRRAHGDVAEVADLPVDIDNLDSLYRYSQLLP